MPRDDYEIDPDLKHYLEDLKSVPPRDPQAAARGRARFLTEAASIKAVSGKYGRRHTVQSLYARKERFAMNMLMTAVLIFTLLFSGTAGTVYAAQDALPTDLLYPVKTLSEDIRLSLTMGPQEQAELLEQLAQTRVQEILALQNQGLEPPDAVSLRLQQHNWQAISLAAGLDDAAMQATLERLRTRLQVQYITLGQTDEASQALLRTRSMLQTQLRLVETGLADPQGFRYIVRLENQNRVQGTPGSTASPAWGPGGYGPGSPSDGTPQQGPGGYGPGSPSDGTPQQGPGGYGPGGSNGNSQGGQGGDEKGKGGSGNH